MSSGEDIENGTIERELLGVDPILPTQDGQAKEPGDLAAI